MLSFSVGPFALSLNHLLLLVALALATLVGWNSGRKQRINPERAVSGLFMLGLLVARLAFVARYWRQYESDLLRIVDIRDGGFSAWPGVVAVVAGAAITAWRRPLQRRPLGLGVASGLLFWWLSSLAVESVRRDVPLPDLALRNGAGERVQLRDYTGRKLVINLWATWCPPCRREMPVLQAAQKTNPDVVFLFVNQGESPREVATFLGSQGLQLDNVLFDDSGELGRRAGSAALPTTLFYGVNGRQRDGHLGELSSASLTHYLDGLSQPPNASSPTSFPPSSQPSSK
ncbi:TlpA family protein disulfide reductase [Pseudomonas graminis]|uniref:Thiol-disulfide isomerase or thioredoxin n=1 Tax=Pseudomonas graminis TaxID=158627 RepID=A0A1I0GH00_9PSED|nr:TlpA disulfide reductase family protein [Pseudomonas graminis]SET69410.1 Thiol-disulfide isomerase or thioredoxin [Pseudomonas graminis]